MTANEIMEKFKTPDYLFNDIEYHNELIEELEDKLKEANEKLNECHYK